MDYFYTIWSGIQSIYKEFQRNLSRYLRIQGDHFSGWIILPKTKGFGLLTGSPGRGKTTTIRSWASNLNPSLYKVIYSSLSTLTPNDFYRNLVRELGGRACLLKKA